MLINSNNEVVTFVGIWIKSSILMIEFNPIKMASLGFTSNWGSNRKVIDKIIDHWNGFHRDSMWVHHAIDSKYHLLHWFSSILCWSNVLLFWKNFFFKMKVAPQGPSHWHRSHLSKWAFTYFIEASNSCLISLSSSNKPSAALHSSRVQKHIKIPKSN